MAIYAKDSQISFLRSVTKILILASADLRASLVAQTVKHLSTTWETWVGKVPGEGNGSPLQYYCLENPMDRGAW